MAKGAFVPFGKGGPAAMDAKKDAKKNKKDVKKSTKTVVKKSFRK